MMSDRDKIILYAKKGYPVFPVANNERYPRISKEDGGNGCYDATTDLDQINEWFDMYPGCNWGIPTGRKTFDVVDIDPKNGGDRVFERYLKLYNRGENLPATAVAQTGTGGWHYLFKPSETPLRNAPIAPGIDIRTDGGYIVVHPSKTDNQYQWLRHPFETELAEMPSWIVELGKLTKTAIDFEIVDGEVPEGSRNNYLTSMCGTMQRRGFSREAMRAALLVERDKRCPGIPDEEVIHIVDSIAKHEPGDPILLRYVNDEEVELNVQMEAESAERTALGFLTGDYDRERVASAEIMMMLDGDMFLVQEHRLIFRALSRLWVSGANLTKDLLLEELRRVGDFGRFNLDEAFVEGLLPEGRRINTVADGRFYATRISHAYMLREATRILRQSTNTAKKGQEAPDVLIGDVAARLMALMDKGDENMVYDTEESVKKIRQFIEDAKKGNLDLYEQTGWRSIDKTIIGIPKRNITIVAARTSQGKTAFVWQMARQMSRRWFANQKNKSVLFFSAEMTTEELMLREISREAKVDSTRITTWKYANITGKEEERIERAISDYAQECQIYLDETPSPSPQYMLAKAMAVNAQHEIGLIVFDFLELVGDNKGEKRFETTERLSRALVAIKEIAKRTGAPVVILSQISREIEKRSTKQVEPRPRLSDLRYTGQAEQLASQVIMLYHPWFFWKGGIPYEKAPTKEEYYVQVGKNRNGKIGTIEMRFIRDFGSIEDPGIGEIEEHDLSDEFSENVIVDEEEVF